MSIDPSITSPVFGNRSGRYNVPAIINNAGVTDADYAVPTRLEHNLSERGGDIARAVISERFGFIGGEHEPTFYNWDWHSRGHLSDMPAPSWSLSLPPSPTLCGPGDHGDGGLDPPGHPCQSPPAGGRVREGDGEGLPIIAESPDVPLLLSEDAGTVEAPSDGTSDVGGGSGTEGRRKGGKRASPQVRGGLVPRRSARIRAL